jgi:hypothetical protein
MGQGHPRGKYQGGLITVILVGAALRLVADIIIATNDVRFRG